MENRTADAQFMIGNDNHLAIDQPGALAHSDRKSEQVDNVLVHDNYEGKPTDEEMKTLRKVSGSIPIMAYFLCFVEFCERGSYYSSVGIITNFVARKMPVGGNGYGAPKRGTNDKPGALNMGQSKANAVGQSFKMLVYCLPVIFGYIADKYTGRYKLIVWGVWVCGVAHVLMLASGAPALLQAGHSAAPFLISLYVLAIGAAMFKPNVSPILLDQITDKAPVVKTLNSGERVIVDPESTAERVVLWFYLLINVGGFLGMPASITAKYNGWLITFMIPLIVYVPLPLVLIYLKKRLILLPPGGSDLVDCFKVLGYCLTKNTARFGRKGFWEAAKPSVMRAKGLEVTVSWDDQFVEDVRRTFQATGMFCFFPIQYLNDNGLGGSADYLSGELVLQGVPNDLLSNLNPISIIVAAPLLNYGLYPFLRKHRIRYGPVARITTGLFMSSIGGLAYTLLQWKAYQLGPCGKHPFADTCVDADGNTLVAPITIWYMAIPYVIGGISELFVNVPAYGIAYSRAPKNMRGLVSALNLFNTGFAYMLGLALSAVIRDPFLTWDFAIPTILGFVLTVIFWFTFKHIDDEEFVLNASEVGHGEKDVVPETQYNNHRDSSSDNLSEKGVKSQSAAVNEKI